MAGSENFNHGNSLAAMGWGDPVYPAAFNLSNTAGAGEDGSFAAKVDTASGDNYGPMPIAPCAISPRVRVSWRWKRDYNPDGGSIIFALRCLDCNPSAWGGTADDWLVNIITETGSGLTGQVMSQGDGGVNVWAISNFVPSIGEWETYQIEIVFSSGFDEPGHDGTRRFGPYPGTVATPNTDAVRAPTADGEIRVWHGADASTLDLVYEVTGIGVGNPYLLAQTSVPYNVFHFRPQGTIDNIEWQDFCGVSVSDEADICGCTSKDPGLIDDGGGIGHGADPVMTPTIGAQIVCVGDGAVPTQADLTFAESWWT